MAGSRGGITEDVGVGDYVQSEDRRPGREPFDHFSLEDEQRKRERASQKVEGKPGVLYHRSQGESVPRIME